MNLKEQLPQDSLQYFILEILLLGEEKFIYNINK